MVKKWRLRPERLNYNNDKCLEWIKQNQDIIMVFGVLPDRQKDRTGYNYTFYIFNKSSDNKWYQWIVINSTGVWPFMTHMSMQAHWTNLGHKEATTEMQVNDSSRLVASPLVQKEAQRDDGENQTHERYGAAHHREPLQERTLVTGRISNSNVSFHV